MSDFDPTRILLSFPKGDQGPPGPRGPRGFKGEKGDTGATGLTGPAGANGTDGESYRWVKDAFEAPGSGPWALSCHPIDANGIFVTLQGQLWERDVEYTVEDGTPVQIARIAGAPELDGTTRRLVIRYQTDD